MNLKDIIKAFEQSRTKCHLVTHTGNLVCDPEADRYIAAKQAIALEDIASHLSNTEEIAAKQAIALEDIASHLDNIEEILDLIRQNCAG